MRIFIRDVMSNPRWEQSCIMSAGRERDRGRAPGAAGVVLRKVALTNSHCDLPSESNLVCNSCSLFAFSIWGDRPPGAAAAPPCHALPPPLPEANDDALCMHNPTRGGRGRGHGRGPPPGAASLRLGRGAGRPGPPPREACRPRPPPPARDAVCLNSV